MNNNSSTNEASDYDLSSNSDWLPETPAQIKVGIYTVVYPCGAHRTLRVKEWEKASNGPALVVGFLSGSDNEESYTYFGFLREDNGINFFRSFAAKTAQNPEVMARIRKAVLTIAGDPKAAGLAYALQSSRCCRCNRTLTVPASIHNGMGPECASRE